MPQYTHGAGNAPEMKMTNSKTRDPNVQQSIDRFKVERANAAKKGLVILPSVDGPYVFDPVTNHVVGRHKSEEYRLAVADQPQAMTKERFLELQSAGESLDLDHAQGRDLPGHYERVQQISELMDASPWTLHPDHGCILSSDVANLDRQALVERP